jgi:uncharacterized protein (DUF305 family)
MKTTIFLALSTILIALAACEKNEDTLTHLQSHDQNRMMKLMHQMMMQMDTTEMTMDPEIDFVRMMKVHHQGAISMANLQLTEGRNDSLKRVAQKIKDEQQAEINQFDIYLGLNSVNNNVPGFMLEHHESMQKMEMLADVQFITGNIDNDFASLMIPHHQAAIDNASSYLKYGTDNQLKAWAERIIDVQSHEIVVLGTWLKNNRR